jgi:hypothetical protein
MRSAQISATASTGVDSLQKKNSPVKVKLERFEAKSSPVKGNKRQPCPLYIMAAKEGIVIAFLSKQNNVDQQAFTGQLFPTFRNNAALCEKHNVTAVMIRRAPASEGYNLPMFATPFPSEQYYFNMFVRIHTDTNDNTPTNNQAWAEQLAAACTEFAKAHFEFAVTFEFKADLSDTNSMPPANKYILNKDVIRLMDFSYPTEHYSRETQANNLAEEYFGEDANTARQLILDFDRPL